MRSFVGAGFRVAPVCVVLGAGVAGCASGDKKVPEVAPLFGTRATDQTISAPGLSARVEIARDQYGVPHIFAHTLEDAAYGQGYMHARDRFFQVDMFRHLVEGKLSEYFGNLTFNNDVEGIAFMLTTD